MSTIILTGGGSAGHCTPNLALLPYLKKQFSQIFYIGSFNGIEKTIIEKANIKYFPIHTAKLKRKFALSNLAIPFEVSKGISEAKKLIETIQPDVVFSKGGFVAVPVVIACHKLKVPVVCHESDYSCGLANRISLRYCDKLLTSFPDTADDIAKAEYIGSPIRKNLFTAKKDYAYFGFNNEKPILLVFGGSLGAKVINDTLRNSLSTLLTKFNIIHICGKNNFAKELNDVKGYYQTEYLFNMEKALSIASVCVARAGSNSLFELLSLKIPCVIIPLPKGISRGDQEQNALFFQKKGFINVLPEKALTTDSLTLAINSTYANRQNYKKIFNQNPILDKSQDIANVLCDYLSK